MWQPRTWPFGSIISEEEWQRVPEFERGALVAELRNKVQSLLAGPLAASGKRQAGGAQ